MGRARHLPALLTSTKERNGFGVKEGGSTTVRAPGRRKVFAAFKSTVQCVFARVAALLVTVLAWRRTVKHQAQQPWRVSSQAAGLAGLAASGHTARALPMPLFKQNTGAGPLVTTPALPRGVRM